MDVIIVEKNTIKLEGFRYFVGSASSILFGGFGEKKTPVSPGMQNYLDQWDVLPAAKLAQVPLIPTTLTVEFADQKGISLFAGIKVPGLGSGEVSLKTGDLSSGKVRLMKISPQGESDLVRQVNDSPAAVRKLIEFDGRARVVESVLIAVEAKLHDTFTAGLTGKGAVIVDGALLRAEMATEAKRTTTITLEKGTCVGYSLAEPKWDASLDKNKTRVVSLREDEQG